MTRRRMASTSAPNSSTCRGVRPYRPATVVGSMASMSMTRPARTCSDSVASGALGVPEVEPSGSSVVAMGRPSAVVFGAGVLGMVVLMVPPGGGWMSAEGERWVTSA